MKNRYIAALSSFLSFFSIVNAQSNSYPIKETYYKKWKVEFNKLEQYSFHLDNGRGNARDFTIVYVAKQELKDGLFGSVGIEFSTTAEPSYIVILSFPMGLASQDDNLVICQKDAKLSLYDHNSLLASSKECYCTDADEVSLRGVDLKATSYIFTITADGFKNLLASKCNKVRIDWGFFYNQKTKQRSNSGLLIEENPDFSKLQEYSKTISAVSVTKIE